jgi:hypothetical protein
MKRHKQARALGRKRDELNSIIHRRNLYSKGRRFIDAQVSAGWLVVRDLYTSELIPFIPGQFFDGYGQEVCV